MDLARPLRVVAPTLDADILKVLASGDVALTGREIQRRIGASQDGVRRALNRLVEEGVVLRDRAGRTHLFRLNRQHLAAPWIEGLATLRLQLVERLRTTIAKWEVQPAAAVLFGSSARGDTTRSSDLDLLIVRPIGCDADDPIWRAQLVDLEAAAGEWTGNDTRVVEYGEQEVAQSGKRDPLLDVAAAEGIDLHGSLRRMLQPTPATRT